MTSFSDPGSHLLIVALSLWKAGGLLGVLASWTLSAGNLVQTGSREAGKGTGGVIYLKLHFKGLQERLMQLLKAVCFAGGLGNSMCQKFGHLVQDSAHGQHDLWWTSSLSVVLSFPPLFKVKKMDHLRIHNKHCCIFSFFKVLLADSWCTILWWFLLYHKVI